MNINERYDKKVKELAKQREKFMGCKIENYGDHRAWRQAKSIIWNKLKRLQKEAEALALELAQVRTNGGSHIE